jgi:HEAT repeat protein
VQSNEQTLAEGSDIALLTAGFGKTPNFEAVLRNGFSSAQPRQRILALRGLVRQSLVTEAEWTQALRDSDDDVRREALHQLAYAQVSSQEVLDCAVGLLTDEHPLVVEACCFVCGEYEIVSTVETLCDIASNHDDARCREIAIAALGSIGDERGLPTILASLNDKPPVRRRAIVALSNFEGPDVDAALERAADDRDWQVRAAVGQLGREED